MIEITRRIAAQFRAAARRCVCRRPKGLSPPVVLEAGEQGVSLFAAANGVGVSLSVPGPRQSPERLIVPIEVLQAVEGNRDDPVSFASAGNRVCCRWTDRGVAVEMTFNTVTSDGSHEPCAKVQPTRVEELIPPIPIEGDSTVPPETDGRANGHAPEEPLHFMAEAESLRDALADVARRAARLVASLKQLQK